MNFEPNIIYEDNHLLVVIKPCNISVQGDDSHDDDLLTLLKNYIKQRDNKPGNVFLGLVHRLDRPTGGVMVFAKTSKCASRLSESFRSHDIDKKYLCVVLGTPKIANDRVESYLKKDPKTNTVHLAPQTEDGAKRAVLDYRVLHTVDGLSLIEVSLQTGRSHQIRVQMSKVLKTPLYNDYKYGDTTHRGDLALWAYYLKFVHPVTNKPMIFKVLPDVTKVPFSYFENYINNKV